MIQSGAIRHNKVLNIRLQTQVSKTVCGQGETQVSGMHNNS